METEATHVAKRARFGHLPGMAFGPLFHRGSRLPLPAPDQTVWAIGDVHGRADLLDRLLDLIRPRPDEVVVTLGDYVDRGRDSRGVIERLAGREGTASLMGNHEAMLIDFLDAPETCGPLWLRNGGGATLESYRVAEDTLPAMAKALSEALGSAEGWLRGLPRLWRSGTLVAVHAALDPARPPERQDATALVWGHPAFGRTARRDGLWVVYGHRIVPEPFVGSGRIAIDTGAFATGRLTAARIAPGEAVRFVST